MSDNGYCKVRLVYNAGGKEGDEVERCEGWVRTRNISRIERKAGLPELKFLAQMAIDALKQNEEKVKDLEEEMRNTADELYQKEVEVLDLRKQLGAMQEALQMHEAQQKTSVAAKPLDAFAVGDRAFVYNAFFQDGSRLRSEPQFIGTEFEFTGKIITNDAEIEVIEVAEAYPDFVNVRQISGGILQGWLPWRDLSRTARTSGLANLRASLMLVIGEATESPPADGDDSGSDTPAAGTSRSLTMASARTDFIESQADEDSVYKAMKAQESAEIAADLAKCLKIALEKSKVQPVEFFRDIDRNQTGRISKADFVKALEMFNTPYSSQQLESVFDVWDADGTGSLDYKELDRAIRNTAKRSTTTSSNTAQDIQKALNDRLKGRVDIASEKAPGKASAAPGKAPAPKRDRSEEVKTADKKVAHKSQKEIAKEAESIKKVEATVREEWAKWVLKIGLANCVVDALKLPVRLGQQATFDYALLLTRDKVDEMLKEAELMGVGDMLMTGLDALHFQSAASGTHLNDKFQVTGKFMMRHGTLDKFFSGLENLIGPPQMIRDPESEGGETPTIRMAMCNEHTAFPDSYVEFTSPNGTTSCSATEWEFAYDGKKDPRSYPERKDFREKHQEWCRKPVPVRDLMEELLEKHCNGRLREEGHPLVILEEFLGGRLYTGPMYMKYNAVLRELTGDPFLVKAFKSCCGPAPFNRYVSTIHAINSCIIKMCKLTKAGKVYRGTCYGKLPEEFWVPNAEGVLGGIEFGFQSTTRDRNQAVHYATGGGYAKDGDAMTLFEMNMGMIDRGAELTWFSQYPHEREVLLPPLTGIEPVQTAVDGQKLEIFARLSLNLAAQTLEQVLSRRRRMLLDMKEGIIIEIKRSGILRAELVAPAIAILDKSLELGALSYAPEWFNDDDNFSLVLNMTLYLQRVLVRDIDMLNAALNKPKLDLQDWPPLGPSRIMLLEGWIGCRPVEKKASKRMDEGADKVKEVLIDLRRAKLSPKDGIALALLLNRQKNIAVDVRGNETLGEEGTNALVNFVLANPARADKPRRTILGVMHDSLTLQVPCDPKYWKDRPYELRLYTAELVSSVFAEGIAGSMGGGGKSFALNRVSTAFRVDWNPLIWAARNNQLEIANELLNVINSHIDEVSAAFLAESPPRTLEAKATSDLKVDANQAEVHGENKTAAHWAGATGHIRMIELLVENGADLSLPDKHGNDVAKVADKKRMVDAVKFLSLNDEERKAFKTMSDEERKAYLSKMGAPAPDAVADKTNRKKPAAAAPPPPKEKASSKK